MAIPRKNSDIPRVVGDFRYLNKRLVKLNMTFPLVRECIQAIGASQCDVMSVIDIQDAYHTLNLPHHFNNIQALHHTMVQTLTNIFKWLWVGAFHQLYGKHLLILF